MYIVEEKNERKGNVTKVLIPQTDACNLHVIIFSINLTDEYVPVETKMISAMYETRSRSRQ